MADVVNRIVPPSVSIDGARSIGREKTKKYQERKNTRRPPKSPPKPPVDSGEEQKETIEPETNQDKGKNLDISA